MWGGRGKQSARGSQGKWEGEGGLGLVSGGREGEDEEERVGEDGEGRGVEC